MPHKYDKSHGKRVVLSDGWHDIETANSAVRTVAAGSSAFGNTLADINLAVFERF